ncbi:HET-domain-containing protein [Trametes meyenii]|nr:HET-domain-containing protein [Trametes meyenii]
MPSSRTRAPLLPVAISQSPLLSGTLSDDLFSALAKPLPTITIGPYGPSTPLRGDRPPTNKNALWPVFTPTSSSSSSSSSLPITPTTPISPKDVISLLNLLESMDNDVATEVQRVRLGIQEARALVRECREESKTRTSAMQKRREKERTETKGTDDDFWLDYQVKRKMWLLDTSTGKMHYVADPTQENYAILSHVWIPGKEQSFQDLQALHVLSSQEVWANRARRLTRRPGRPALNKASEKIRECCAFAKARGYRWLWVDTCCIDKTSSAELSEAINSMYQWYAQAGVCYAFLHDVDDAQDPRPSGSQFRQSRWFRRGWTLQELIAPRELVFISKQWRPFGTKTSLADVIEEITGVERAILELRRPLNSVSVARRMSWASKRKTTRVEDEAYSLMGIFGVNIPAIYGEGRNAFYRLQEEILRHVPDQSIFAWGPFLYKRYEWPCEQVGTTPLIEQQTEDVSNGYLFAPSPTAFEHAGGVTPLSLDELRREIKTKVSVPEYTITSYGIRTQLPFATRWQPTSLPGTKPQLTIHLALLACSDADDGLIVIILRSPPDLNHNQYKVGCRYPSGFVRGASLRALIDSRVIRFSVFPDPFQTPSRTFGGQLMEGSFELSSVYIPYRPFELTVESYASRHRNRPQYAVEGSDARAMFFCPCEVVIPPWTLAQLRKAGYKISTAHIAQGTSVIVPDEKDALVSFVLSRGGDSIYIGLAPCPVPHGSLLPRRLTILVSFGQPPVPTASPAEVPKYSYAQPIVPLSESCKKTHVEQWQDGCMEITGEGRTLGLAVNAWTSERDSGNGRGLYALTITLRDADR